MIYALQHILFRNLPELKFQNPGKEQLFMTNVKIDFQNIVGKIKPMHAVNNGPVVADKVEQTRGNSEAYQAAHIPYARVHDSAFFEGYGGEHAVDISAIFPDFRNNPYDEDSYDFALTDDYLASIHAVGTEVFFRFGSKIEHARKKYGTKVPADFGKFAVVCEHIIRHYNEGWANGFHFGIRYWEIWNEPVGEKSNGDQPNWSGTPEEYYEMYTVTARHLKKRFPHLKIGGPAMSWVRQQWFDDFLAYLTTDTDRVPLDFFSWHAYANDPYTIQSMEEYVRRKLRQYGYTETESICNEYNYLLNFTDRYVESIQNIIGIRGAAFTAATMSVGQDSSLSMLMYYDARPCVFNGMFDFYTFRRLKGYYPFLYFSYLYALGDQVMSESMAHDVYITAASGKDGKAFLLTYYQEEGIASENRNITIDTGVKGRWHITVTDIEKDCNSYDVESDNGIISIAVTPNTILFAEIR